MTNDTTPYVAFGAQIYLRRKARGISTEDMAKLLSKTPEGYNSKNTDEVEELLKRVVAE